MENYKEIRVKSVLPIYLTGLVWVVCMVVLPVYSWSGLLISVAVSAAAYVVFSQIFKGHIEKVELPVETGDDYADTVINRCKGIMADMKALRGKIGSAAVNTRIEEILKLSDSIFSFLIKHPQKVAKVRQFESYLLPTTCELLNSYHELEQQKTKGKNINSAMEEIEETLPKIEKAYKRILDDLFQDKAVDVSVEVAVMEKIINERGVLDEPEK